MLFNSIEFLLIFLPLALLVFFWVTEGRAALVWVSCASLIFYGYWNPIYLFLIVTSVLANFGLGKLIGRSVGTRRYWATALGIVLNLSLLGYFKYANFFVSEVAAVAGLSWSIDTIVLPLAISFFTFQQIAYLVDAYQGKVPDHGLVEYVAFVTFFPQLIAGPIVHQRDVLPQFRALGQLRKNTGNLSVGLSIFAIGIFKKVAIADELAIYANPVFDAALAESAPSIAEAWVGVLAYTFQLYFDFSGYSDMAIGLGLMFGIMLPINFASPYKARNIVDFWRAWHITLSNFLRDYLYIPLGGSRFGSIARYRNLLVTMVLGGLWHGAAWTFVVWGALHGLYLTINHVWRAVPSYQRIAAWRGYSYAAWGLTLACVIVGWIFFRAANFDAALAILKSMAGLNGLDLPQRFAAFFQPTAGAAVAFDGFFPNTPIAGFRALGLVLLAGVIALFAPNVFEIFHRQLSADMNSRVPYRATRIAWKPNVAWALLSGGMLAYCLLSLSEPSEFLYFQF